MLECAKSRIPSWKRKEAKSQSASQHLDPDTCKGYRRISDGTRAGGTATFFSRVVLFRLYLSLSFAHQGVRVGVREGVKDFPNP